MQPPAPTRIFFRAEGLSDRAPPAADVAMRNRRLALEGLAKMLDAGALEELFTGPDDEAAFGYDLLVDTAPARSSGYYQEICPPARRRGVTPGHVLAPAPLRPPPAGGPPETPAPAPAPPPSQMASTLLWNTARLLQTREALDRRFEPEGGIGGLLSRLEAALAPVGRHEIDDVRAEVDR